MMKRKILFGLLLGLLIPSFAIAAQTGGADISQ